MTKLKQWLSGKRTYLIMTAGVLTALAGWANDAVTTKELLEVLFAAVGAVFLRAAVAKGPKE